MHVYIGGQAESGMQWVQANSVILNQFKPTFCRQLSVVEFLNLRALGGQCRKILCFFIYYLVT